MPFVPDLSVIVITYNEERNIERCLRSVQWADEVIVIDAFSDDRTVEICKSLDATVVQRAWDGFAPQKQYALSCASRSWVLLVDADEEVTPELHEEIISAISSPDSAEGYEIPRKSFFLGQWMKHGGWYPGYQLRLFLRSRASISQRPVHEGVELRGNARKLKNGLNHYTYFSLSQYLTKLNDYTSLDVLNKLSQTKGRRVRWYNFILNPASVFIRMFVVLAGFKDGFRGFLLAVYSSFYKFLLFAKAWEYQTATERKQPTPPVTSVELNSIKRHS
ncbi:MAG TPA: glycosyltransferase family 2 protein [Bacteroidota bacterium]|nr:glycosyltransferase family 2 protein [Bacteroidota bacterium]